MKLKDFLTEKWMNNYEREARYNLTDTSCDALSMNDLLACQPDALADLPLDYGWITGDPALRQEILSLYSSQDEDTLTTTCGALQGTEMVMAMLLGDQDHVITFTPGYQQFADFPRWLGCDVSEIELCEEDWSLDLETLKAALKPNTRLIVFANPSNPTGTWLNKERLNTLAAIAREHTKTTGQPLWILCDEVYRDPMDENQPAISDVYEYGVSTGSFSKLLGLAGLRLGWIKGNADLIDKINTFRDYTIISAGPLSERLGAIALQNKEQILEMKHDGMFFGVHGYNHYWLGKLTPERMHKDIEKALDYFQDVVDRECWVMSYPYGNYTDDVLDYIKKSGCVLGVSVVAETTRFGIHNSLILPRYDANDVFPQGDRV